MVSTRLITTAQANRGKVLLLLCIIVSLYMLLSNRLVSNMSVHSRTVTPSIHVLLNSDILSNIDNEESTFVLLPQSKLREFMKTEGKNLESRTKSTDSVESQPNSLLNVKDYSERNPNHLFTAVKDSESNHEGKQKATESTKNKHNTEIRIVPKPDLSRMINASQSINTIHAPYFLENSLLCSSVPDLAVIIIVHTACGNFERRMSIRTTWANSMNYKEQIRILFLVGITANTVNETKQQIKAEFNKYGDLLVGDFSDSYHNLTLKGVMAYKWLSERCRNAKMVLKVDDDITVNMFRFFTDIYSKYAQKPRHIICNYILSGSMPILRDRNSKWFVSEKHFKGFSEYPTDYCSGFFVAMTNDLMPAFYASAKITPFFWVDDVYLYGLVPGNVPGVQYIGLQGNWHMLGGQDALKCYKNATQTCPFLALGAGAKGEPEDLWHEILKRQAIAPN